MCEILNFTSTDLVSSLFTFVEYNKKRFLICCLVNFSGSEALNALLQFLLAFNTAQYSTAYP